MEIGVLGHSGVFVASPVKVESKQEHVFAMIQSQQMVALIVLAVQLNHLLATHSAAPEVKFEIRYHLLGLILLSHSLILVFSFRIRQNKPHPEKFTNIPLGLNCCLTSEPR